MAPSRIQYANWFASRSRTFNYTINPNRNISSPPNNDSAVLYYWGHNEETAVSIDANGGSLTRVAALFSTRPGIVPPFINNNICIMANRIFDVCRQAVTRTKKQTIPSGILLGCKVKHAQCFVKRTNKGDNPGDIVQVKVVLRIAYMIDIQGKIMHVIRPFVFSAQARLLVPENATVDCEVLNTTCESTQLESSLVETTVQAFIQLQSKGTESIVIPFVASCPLRLCPTNTIGIAELNPGTGKDSLTWQDAGEDHNMEQDAGTEKDHNTEKDVDEDYNTE